MSNHSEGATRAVLVVDDDREFLDTVRTVLSTEGHRVLTALSPLEALWVLEQARVDIIVCDWMLRNSDGLAFLGLVRDRWPHVARVLVSGAIERLGSRETTPPAQAVIAKPCDMAALSSLVRSLPERGDGRERRRWPRSPQRFAARIARDHIVRPCKVERLSAAGALLIGGPWLPAGSLVSVFLLLPSSGELRLAARVISCHAVAADDYACAVQFYRLHPDDEDRIHQAVLDSLERARDAPDREE